MTKPNQTSQNEVPPEELVQKAPPVELPAQPLQITDVVQVTPFPLQTPVNIDRCTCQLMARFFIKTIF